MLRAASWLHERPHADVLTSLKLHLPATDLHHITAVRRSQVAEAAGAAAGGAGSQRSAGGVQVLPL